MANYTIGTRDDFINVFGSVIQGNTSADSEPIYITFSQNVSFDLESTYPHFGGGLELYNIHIDGSNHIISNFAKVIVEDFALFGVHTLHNSSVKNLIVANATLEGTANVYDFFKSYYDCTFENVHFTGINTITTESVYLCGGYIAENCTYTKCSVSNCVLNCGYSYVFCPHNASYVSNNYWYCVSNNSFIGSKQANIFQCSVYLSSKKGICYGCVCMNKYDGFNTVYEMCVADTTMSLTFCYSASQYENCSTVYVLRYGKILSSYLDIEVAGQGGCTINTLATAKATTAQLKSESWLRSKGWLFNDDE